VADHQLGVRAGQRRHRPLEQRERVGWLLLLEQRSPVGEVLERRVARGVLPARGGCERELEREGKSDPT
jgi:hypothetical protein